MKFVWTLALLAAAAAQAQTTGEPVVAPPSTERFLNTVPPFAGGSMLPAQEIEKPLAYRDVQGSKAASLPVPESQTVQRGMTPGQTATSPWR